MIKVFRGKTPEIHESCFIAENAAVIGAVTLGKNVSVWYGASLRGDEEKIEIGGKSNVQDCCVIHTQKGYPVRIGSNVSVGHGAIVHGAEVGDHVIVGMGAILMNGVKIGRHSVIGAGALCTENTVIPEGSLVMGSPAKVIRALTEEERSWADLSAATYISLSEEHRGQE
jgi:carbonic anhydrase/acetyltransferase-like protein (isoleucine patch superfamily)